MCGIASTNKPEWSCTSGSKAANTVPVSENTVTMPNFGITCVATCTNTGGDGGDEDEVIPEPTDEKAVVVYDCSGAEMNTMVLATIYGKEKGNIKFNKYYTKAWLEVEPGNGFSVAPDNACCGDAGVKYWIVTSEARTRGGGNTVGPDENLTVFGNIIYTLSPVCLDGSEPDYDFEQVTFQGATM